MRPAFGTDGIRGDANQDLPDRFVEALGQAASEVLGGHSFAIGCDQRISSRRIVEALSRGVRAVGGSPEFLGALPTPAVALWCAQHDVAGAMVSASHNPWHDNGVKFFAPAGLKLTDRQQRRIEDRLAQLDVKALGRTEQPDAPGAAHVGARGLPQAASVRGDPRERHISEVVASLADAADTRSGAVAGRGLTGMRLVVDCANGAASESGPRCLRRLGADVIVIHDRPDGYNINRDCGSLNMQSLQRAVTDNAAHAGIAFDGDADRVLAVDHLGQIVDGDQILAICAIDRRERGTLAGDTVVVTVMANLGLRVSLEAHGIAMVETPVGDRHVLSALEENGLTLGGEQSGHLIFRDLATTGCGMLTAVQLLDTVNRSGSNLHELASAAMTRTPQVLLNVAFGDPTSRSIVKGSLAELKSDADSRLQGNGRVLLRVSGTEPVVRVMVEAFDEAVAQAEAQRLVLEVEKALN